MTDDTIKQAAEQARELLDDTMRQAAKRAREVLADPVAEWVENLLLLVAHGFADDANTVRASVATGLAPAVLALPVPAPAVDREAVARLIHVEVAKVEFEIDQAHYECGNNAHPARMETWDDLDSGEKRVYLNAVDALISAGLVRVAGPAGQDGGD